METLKFEPFKKLESLEEVENQKLASTLCSLKLNSGFLAFPDKMSGEEQVDASHSNTGTASKTTLPGSAKIKVPVKEKSITDPFETKKLLKSLQSSANRCTKSKIRIAEKQVGKTGFTLRPPKLILKNRHSFLYSSTFGRMIRKRERFAKGTLDTIPEESSDSTADEHPILQPQSCSQQATSNVELNINELASYFDLYLHLPKKMSPMAEMMYT